MPSAAALQVVAPPGIASVDDYRRVVATDLERREEEAAERLRAKCRAFEGAAGAPFLLRDRTVRDPGVDLASRGAEAANPAVFGRRTHPAVACSPRKWRRYRASSPPNTRATVPDATDPCWKRRLG